MGGHSSPFTLTFENKHDGSYSGDVAVDSIRMKNCDQKSSCTGAQPKRFVQSWYLSYESQCKWKLISSFFFHVFSRCKNNRNYCYSEAQTCDLVNDCGDNTDETSCKNVRCNFDAGLCNWKNVNGEDDFDWTRNQGSTGSYGTGPSTDHTTGTGIYNLNFFRS